MHVSFSSFFLSRDLKWHRCLGTTACDVSRIVSFQGSIIDLWFNRLIYGLNLNFLGSINLHKSIGDSTPTAVATKSTKKEARVLIRRQWDFDLELGFFDDHQLLEVVMVSCQATAIGTGSHGKVGNLTG